MGKKKSATQTASNQTSTVKYGWETPPPNKYVDQAAAHVAANDGGRAAIVANYGRQRNDINNAGNEFFGAQTNDEVRQKTRENRLFRSNADMGRDLGQAAQDENAYKAEAFLGLGMANAPQLVQTGGTQSGSGTVNNQQWGSGLYSPLGQLGLGAVSAGLGA